MLGRALFWMALAGWLRAEPIDNLIAFTRLAGYVRYFYPSDEAAAADWEKLMVEAIPTVEAARTPAELAGTLEEIFRPVAPAVRVYVTGRRPAWTAPERKPYVIAWRHVGVGLGTPQSIYSSRRVSSLELGAAPSEFPDPAQPYEADLRGGVSALIPLAVYSDGLAWPARPVVAPGRRADRATRLAAVAIAWNVFQHFYPYFDVVGADWPGALRRALQAASSDADELAFLRTLRRLVAELGDGHGNVFHASEPKPFVPPLLWSWIEDRLVVTVGGAGVEAGEVIVKVDGRPAAAALVDREQYISGATAQWKRYHAARVLLAGPQDSELTVEVEGRGSVTLRRTVPVSAMREPRPAKIEEVRPGIVYVDLDRITDEEFTAALPRMEQARGIVFDLRGYPRVSAATLGHLIEGPVTSPQWQIPVVTRPDGRDRRFEFSNWPVVPKAPRLRGRAAFLTDGRAISYAETYLGIVEHYRLAEIVGEPTAGTNGNVNPFSLPGGYRVSWTGMKVLKHDGSRHHGVGIQPTAPVSRTVRGVREGRDEVLERAVEIVRGRAPPGC